MAAAGRRRMGGDLIPRSLTPPAARPGTMCNLSGCLAAIRPPSPVGRDAGGEVGRIFAGEGHGGIEDPREPCPTSLRLAGICANDLLGASLSLSVETADLERVPGVLYGRAG
jgi:hypothetical protein